jgi:hypothetical protein
MSTKDVVKSEAGKGGNWDVRPNPFKRDSVPPRAALTEAPNALLAVEMAIQNGCAVMLGGTRDGGATVITVLDGDQRPRTYCHTAEELRAAFDALLAMYV